DGNELGFGWLAVADGLKLMLSGAEAEFFGTGAGDGDFVAVEEDLDVGVIDFDDECAVAADNADDRGGDRSDARRLGKGQTDAEKQRRGGSELPMTRAKESGDV